MRGESVRVRRRDAFLLVLASRQARRVWRASFRNKLACIQLAPLHPADHVEQVSNGSLDLRVSTEQGRNAQPGFKCGQLGIK